MNQKRTVKIKEGKRVSDASIFRGLEFDGPFHGKFFLTPGQFSTVISTRRKAEQLIKELKETKNLTPNNNINKKEGQES